VVCDVVMRPGAEWESREPVLHWNRGWDGGLLPEPQISATLRPHFLLTCNQSCSQVCVFHIHIHYSHSRDDRGATVVQEVKKSVSNQKVASSIPCRSVLEQGTEPLIAPDVHCAISVNVKMCIPCKSLWIKASAK